MQTHEDAHMHVHTFAAHACTHASAPVPPFPDKVVAETTASAPLRSVNPLPWFRTTLLPEIDTVVPPSAAVTPPRLLREISLAVISALDACGIHTHTHGHTHTHTHRLRMGKL